MQPIVHTKDLDALFFPQLDEVARDLSTPGAKCSALHLAMVMKSESDCRATAHNDNPKHLPPEKRWNASGLIQFMPYILPGLGWGKGHEAFRKLTATQQLPYVRRYFSPHRGQLTSPGAIYVATFLPALLRHAGNPGFVLTAKDGPLGWAYGPNAVFDANRDYAITVGELEDAVRRNCVGPRWAEIKARLGDGVIDEHDLDTGAIDLRTTLGIQRALVRLGHSPGEIDGYPGPRTTAAVASFQKSAALKADGIVGPMTRAAMEIALKKRG